MKKKIVSALMVAAMVVTAFAGCGSDKGGTSTQGGDKTSKSSGKVYMLNFKPETDEAWQDLAATYTDQTGVEVNVLTAADGQYNTTLQSEMAKSDAPTIFNVGNSSAAQTWNDYTYDLKDSELYKHLTDKSLVINYDDKVAAIANCYECYGLIYNKTILEGYCGMDGAVVSSVDEINNFDTLKKVADDINSRIDDINKELGTDLTEAFASAGLDDGSSWRFAGHLANMPLYYEFKDDGCDLTAGGSGLIPCRLQPGLPSAGQLLFLLRPETFLYLYNPASVRQCVPEFLPAHGYVHVGLKSVRPGSADILFPPYQIPPSKLNTLLTAA